MGDQQLGVDHLTALALAPLDFVRAAAEAGFASASLRTIHIDGGRPAWAEDPVDAAAIAAVAVDRGIRVHAIEAVAISRELHRDVRSLRGLLEQGAAMDAGFVYCFADDEDTARCADTFSELAALAAEHGMRALLEPMPYRAIATLADASALADAANARCSAAPGAGAPGAGLIVDALHASRGGTLPADLARLPREQLAVLQLCDAPAAAPSGQAPSGLHPLMHEARFDRLEPGAGELPLAAFASAMPSAALLTVEAPGRAVDGDIVARLRAMRDTTIAALAGGASR